MTITYDSAARYVEYGWVTPEQAEQAERDLEQSMSGYGPHALIGRLTTVLERAAGLVDTDDLNGVDHDDLAATIGRGLALVAAWTEAQR